MARSELLFSPVDRIYAVVLDPTLWSKVLQEIAAAFDDTGNIFFARRSTSPFIAYLGGFPALL
jgi:hypothetical protein